MGFLLFLCCNFNGKRLQRRIKKFLKITRSSELFEEISHVGSFPFKINERILKSLRNSSKTPTSTSQVYQIKVVPLQKPLRFNFISNLSLLSCNNILISSGYAIASRNLTPCKFISLVESWALSVVNKVKTTLINTLSSLSGCFSTTPFLPSL